MEYITPMLIGSIIGYFTNWLAIRMLFRPHEEKRIFGFKIPFTPGMIPKERGRIARSVGETVEDYLLTPEGILKIISSDKSQDQLKDWMREEIASLRGEDLKTSDILNKLQIDRTRLEEKISNLTLGYIVDYLADGANKMELLVGIESVYDNLSSNILGLVDKRRAVTEEELEEFILAELNNYLEDMDGEMVLEEFISQDILEGLDYLIDENREIIVTKARGILMADGIQMSLLGSVRSLVDENVSKLITTFVASESIVAKVVESINKYIASDDFEDIVIQAIGSSKDELLDVSLSRVVGLVDAEVTTRRFLEKIDLSGALRRGLSDLVKNYKARSIGAIYSYLVDLENKPTILAEIDLLVRKTLGEILDVDINRWLDNLGEDDLDFLFKKLTSIIEDIDPQVFIKLIDMLKIGDIIEEEINSFEIDFAEKLILDIADKELKAITNLGAVLGAILGLLSPLIKYL